MSDYFRYLMRR